MTEINHPSPDQTAPLISNNKVRRSLQFIIPIFLILISALIISFFTNNEPEKKKKKNNLTPPLTVSVLDIEPQSFQVNIESYGTVSPRTQSTLVSQVNGQITYISDQLREGSFFAKGDLLLKIDDRDYLADVKISEASLADAQQALAEEMALSSQATLDWKNLGNNNPPNDLVLRKPQQQAARARLASAEAALSKTKLSLERTHIVAPYDGRVLQKEVGIGQVTNVNTQIAQIYATDYFEVRLPLRSTDLKFINLPETFRDKKTTSPITSVNVYSTLPESPIAWSGRLVRTESAIDNNARQLHVVAQIDDPFNADNIDRSPLKIGEYVTAKISGKNIDDAIVIPAGAIYQNTYVYVVTGDVIKRRNVQIDWQDQAQALISSGLSSGDKLVITTLGQVASGTRVLIEGQVRKKKGKPQSDQLKPEQQNNKSAGAQK